MKTSGTPRRAHGRRPAQGWLKAAGAAAALAPSMAWAQEPPRRFDLDSAPPSQALVQLAVQAGVSINLNAARACRGPTRAVHAVLTVRAALERMLEGTGCSARRIDASTYVVTPDAPKPVHAPEPPVAAPASRPSPPTPLSEVLVTATKRLTAIDRAPYSLSAMTQPQLQDARVADAGDLAGEIAGMTVTNLGPGRDKILIRGLSDGPLTGHTQSTVGIYLDNVRITYDAPDPDLRLVDVARVEVLKGPQGSLYGAGSIGGILHIVTRAPEPGRYSAWLSATASATEGGAPGGVVEGVVNAPLGTRSAVRIAAYDEIDGGYFDNVRLGLDNVNRSYRRGVRASALLGLAPGWTLTATAVQQTISSDDTQYGDAALAPFQRAAFLREPHDNDFTSANLTLSGTGRLGRLTATTAYVHHEIASIYDASAALPYFAPLQVQPSPFDEDNRIEMLVNELTLASDPGGRVQWLAGAFYSRGEKDAFSTLSTAADSRVVYREDRKDLIDEAAVYGELSVKATNRLQLTAGGRLFRSTIDAASDVTFADPSGQRSFKGRLADTGFAPKLVASYGLGRTLVYLQAAEGYRAGGFNTGGPYGQVFGSQGSGQQPYRRYNGDELWNYEAGVKLFLLQSRLRLHAAAFYSVWTDIQMDQLLPSGVSYTANIGDGHVRGVEAEAELALGALSLRANLILNTPELVRPDPSFPARADSGLPGVPSVAYGGGFTWRRPVGRGLTALVEGDFAYVGGSHLTFDATTSPVMGNYVVSRASLGVEGGRWRAVLFVDNLANNRGDTFAYGNPFTLRLFHQVTPQRPRTVGLTLSRSY